MAAVIGVDIGTTSTIGILIEPASGRVLSTASRPVTLSSPHPGWTEEDPEEWWANLCAITAELLAGSGVPASAIAGIAITGMLPAMVLLDADGEVLRPSIQQSDGRCGREVDELRSELDEAAFTARAGNGINQQLISARLRWVARHEPEIFARIATVFGSYDYINWRLTGRRAAERNWALEAGFVDIRDGALAPDLIALGGVPTGAVPPLTRSDEILGTLTAEAAAATGLAAGTPVTGGAADHIASAFAAGIRAPGDVLLKFGGSVDILVASAAARPDPRLFLDYHLVPGLYVPNGCMATGGSGLNWFAGQIAHGAEGLADGPTPHARLDALAARTPPGADGVTFVPYLLGEKTPVHDPDARGIISGLSLSHDLGHLWRALLEGYAYGLRHHVEVLAGIGYPMQRFIASDGGARSRVWMQIIADILQVEVQLLEGHPGSCLGAAWTTCVATGLDADWEGIARFVSPGAVIAPDPSKAGLYDQGYARFRETYERLAPLHRPAPA